MLGSAIIVFREVLEASLIVGIVMAAARGVAGRNAWVAGGGGAGMAGAGLVAVFASSIAAAAAGTGQELLNATVLFLAVAMLGWHTVWMSRHGRELAAHVGAVGHAVSSGARPLYALAIIVGVAVLREGSETVLFVYGVTVSSGERAATVLAGCALGLTGGVVLGAALYLGLLRIPLHRLFAVTNLMILLLAAGMAAQGAGFLVEADWLPPWGEAVWNTSWLLSEASIPGKMLHTLVGYVAEPSGIQLVFYLTTLVVIGALARHFGSIGRPSRRSSARPAAALLPAAAATGLALAMPNAPAHAEFKLRSPIVEYRELEIEHNWDTTFDRRKSGKSNNQSYTNELEYGFLPWWKFGLEGEWGAPSGQNLRYLATTFENYFQFAPQGKYWADPGFFVEYSRAMNSGDADAVTFGPLVQKEGPPAFGYDSLHLLNLLFTRELGSHARDTTPLFVAWQSRLRVSPFFEPGVEFYGTIDDLANPSRLSAQQHRIGPMFAGLYAFPPYGKIKYEAGYLFGLTHATEQGAVRWRVEFELAF